MPQIKSAKKALRQNARKRVINDRWRRLLHDAIHSLQKNLNENKPEEASTAYIKAQSAIDKAARHNIIHRRQAARLKSKLNREIKAAP